MAGLARSDPPRGAGAAIPAARVGGAPGLVLVASPIARRIVILNLSALLLLIAGILFLEPSPESLQLDRERRLLVEGHRIADALAGPLAAAGRTAAESGTFALPPAVARRLAAQGARLSVYGAEGRRLGVFGHASGSAAPAEPSPLAARLRPVLDGASRVAPAGEVAAGRTMTAAVPILARGRVQGVAVLSDPAAASGRRLWQSARREVLQVSTVALLVALGLSLMLAGTIATPLSELAAAAETGRDANARHLNFGRIRIPDLSARSDEIGRLSAALRGLLAALYARIETNEQFASEVAHEVKNPLASLRSAVGTLPRAPDPEKRARLIEIMEHDLRRLDRLMSDISDASRLDRDLVLEAEAEVDLLGLLRGLAGALEERARESGVTVATDLPEGPIMVQGLEARLAQVFDNIVANALSFSAAGDVVRIRVRKGGNEVRVVFEDSGPGLPESALDAVFDRFYSERADEEFGEHSGLGLAIAKEIVEVHGGTIWAENIRATGSGPAAQPLGARFVVALPL